MKVPLIKVSITFPRYAKRKREKRELQHRKTHFLEEYKSSKSKCVYGWVLLWESPLSNLDHYSEFSRWAKSKGFARKFFVDAGGCTETIWYRHDDPPTETPYWWDKTPDDACYNTWNGEIK